MKWLRDNAISVFMASVVVVTAAVGYGTVRYQCEQHDKALARKADKETVYRELDQLHDGMVRIESKVDELLKRPN